MKIIHICFLLDMITVLVIIIIFHFSIFHIHPRLLVAREQAFRKEIKEGDARRVQGTRGVLGGEGGEGQDLWRQAHRHIRLIFVQ